jgi:hypothetical protein
MGRALLATALGGAAIAPACAVVAGLSATYSAAGPPEDGGDAPSSEHDVAGPIPPSCTRGLSCPSGAFLCDDFAKPTLDPRWTRFDNDASIDATQIDPSRGCPSGSLEETSTDDVDLGVYASFGGRSTLALDADVFLDLLDPGGEGDVLKLSVAFKYDLRVHFASGQLYLLEVVGNDHREHAKRAVRQGSWLHLSVKLDRQGGRCSLAVDQDSVTEEEALGLPPPPEGELIAAASARWRMGSPLQLHLDNVVIQ